MKILCRNAFHYILKAGLYQGDVSTRVQTGLDINRLIAHSLGFKGLGKEFEGMPSGLSGKVILNRR
jgi:hypothetical protein